MIEYVDEHYLRRLFTRSSEKNSLTRLFEKLALTEHYANMYAATGHTGITPIPSSARIEPVAETDAETDVAAAAAAAAAVAAAAATAAAGAPLEKTPLLGLAAPPAVPPALSVSPPAVSAAPRPRGKFPLLRQQSAPLFLLSAPRSEPSLADGAVDSRLRGVATEKPSNGVDAASPLEQTPLAADQALRRALRNSNSEQYKRVRFALLLSTFPPLSVVQTFLSNPCFRETDSDQFPRFLRAPQLPKDSQLHRGLPYFTVCQNQSNLASVRSPVTVAAL